MATFFAVPAKAIPSKCKAPNCRRRIFWIVTGRGKRMPIDVDVEGGKVPTRTEPGRGVPHWATCPAAKEFKKT